jgi:hypothetical protein
MQVPVYDRPQVEQAPLPGPRMDIPSGPNPLQYLGKGLQEFSNDLTLAQHTADKAEAARSVAEGGIEFEGILQQNKDTIQDPQQFFTKSTDDVKNAFQSRLDKATTPQARALIEAGLSDNVLKAGYQTKHLQFEKTKDKALGDLDATEEFLTSSALESPEKRDQAMSIYGNLVGTAKGAGVLDEQSTFKRLDSFKKKVMLKGADAQVRTSPGGFLADVDAGKWNGLDLDSQIKFSDQARAKIEADDKASEKVFTQVKAIVDRGYSAAANSGSIPEGTLTDALNGRNPYVTPDRARELAHINENPPSGETTDPIRAIMQQYHSGTSSYGRINAARASLRQLEKQSTRPNPLIDKAYNELQTDERTMTGIDATRVNRDVTAAKEAYEAENPKPPFRIPGLDAKREQDKAKIGQAVRRSQDPTPIIKQNAQRDKAKASALPDDLKDMRKALGK